MRVRAGTEIPPTSILLGAPAKVVRETTSQEKRNILDQLEELQGKAKGLKNQ